jgi:erythromycin esterase
MRLNALIALLAPLTGLAQTGPANLDFEAETPGRTPSGWVVPTAGYVAEIRHEGCKAGSGCVALLQPTTPSSAPFGNIMQAFSAEQFRGKTVRLRAWIRVDKADAGDHAQMWLRVDRPGMQMGLFDNMGDRPISSSEWVNYEIGGEVEADALSINIGVMSIGKARVWVDDATFEIVSATPQETAAREEFQKLYARIDAAYESGTLDEIAALALPDAQVASGAMRQPMSAVFAAAKEELGKGTKFSSRTTVNEVRLSGDDAVVSTKSEAGIARAGSRSDYESTSRDTWTRTASGWRMKESFAISTHPVTPKADPETVKAVVAELKQRAAPLATVAAGNKMDDLAAFGKAVGDARLVALGEASHGTREFFQMKHRLLEYLVKEKGFTVFAIEANWPEALAVDRYIKTGEGDAAAALSGMYFWTWNTEEVRDMIEWMRAYNQAAGVHPTLTFTSFDMQTGRVAAQKALDYLKRYSTADAPAAEGTYAETDALDGAGATDARAQGASDRAAAVLKVFDSKRPEMEKASSPAAWLDARQAAAVAYQACAMRTPGKGPSYRDQMMAKNVEWLADEAYPGEKIVLWAHNGHVRFGSEPGGKSMGTWLRERFGRKLYVAGFAFRRGQLRAVGAANGQMTGLADHAVPPAPEGSGDAILSAAGMSLFFLDMSSLAAGSPLGRWLAESQLYYNVGAVWQTANAEANLFPEALAKSYDGLIFVEEGHAARGLAPQR